MAHGLNSMIKREIDCNNVSIKSPVAQTTLSPNSAAVNNSVSSTGSAQTCGNAKMGSRRIFTPQFKLQVLESYRNDSDCKGNQRATARKYGIHRRQIQKWLQCESNLRSSVANLNQSTIKHQFHNISHQMPVVSTGTHTNSSSSHSQHHQQQYKANNMLSLDTARHSVALTPITLPATTPTISVAAAAVSSVARAIAAAAATTTTTTTTKCVNGSNHNTTTIKSHTNTASVTLTTVEPPYSMNVMHVPDTAVLTHTPAVSNVVPLNPLHYHHHQQQHQQQQQSRLLMPSASLPMPGSPVSVTTNRTDELRDYQPIGVMGNCYMNEDHRNPPIYESLHYFNSHGGVAPIDLSLGLNRRREFNISENLCYITSTGASSWRKVDSNDRNNNNSDKYEERRDPELNSNMSSHAVDLTCRKRKNNFCSADDIVIPGKVQKTCDDDKEAGTVASAVDVDGTGKDGEHHQQQQQQQQQQAKPVKLFKPYLLDDENEEGKKSIKCEHDPIIWSHHPTCVTPSGYESQSSSAGSNFPLSSSPNDRYPFPTGSPTFQIHATTFDRIATAATPASPPQQSAGTGTSASYWCPKGSPVSGYDSASTYSDSSDYYRSPSHPSLQTYSIDFKMQAIDSYYHDLTCRGDQLAVAGKYNVHTREVQRWLDQETNIRQGIALYV